MMPKLGLSLLSHKFLNWSFEKNKGDFFSHLLNSESVCWFFSLSLLTFLLVLSIVLFSDILFILFMVFVCMWGGEWPLMAPHIIFWDRVSHLTRDHWCRYTGRLQIFRRVSCIYLPVFKPFTWTLGLWLFKPSLTSPQFGFKFCCSWL